MQHARDIVDTGVSVRVCVSVYLCICVCLSIWAFLPKLFSELNDRSGSNES